MVELIEMLVKPLLKGLFEKYLIKLKKMHPCEYLLLQQQVKMSWFYMLKK